MNVFSFKYRNLIMGVTATAVGYYAVLAPHTVFLDKYRYVTARYQADNEIPVGPAVKQRIQKVMDDMKLSDKVRNVIRPFSAFSFDLFHAGTLNPRYGAILGIPANFINSAKELRDKLTIREELVDWTRQDAQAFLDAAILSENAQDFALAREILWILAEEPYFNSLTLAAIIAIFWSFYNAITHAFKLRERNVIVCRMLYLSFALIGAISWFGIKDYRSYNLDKKHSEVLCDLGPRYVEGGQEFYDKLIRRNKALRTLMGDDGKDTYTAYGNEKTVLRQKYVPLTHKKEFFDSRPREDNKE